MLVMGGLELSWSRQMAPWFGRLRCILPAIQCSCWQDHCAARRMLGDSSLNCRKPLHSHQTDRITIFGRGLGLAVVFWLSQSAQHHQLCWILANRFPFTSLTTIEFSEILLWFNNSMIRLPQHVSGTAPWLACATSILTDWTGSWAPSGAQSWLIVILPKLPHTNAHFVVDIPYQVVQSLMREPRWATWPKQIWYVIDSGTEECKPNLCCPLRDGALIKRDL